MPIHCALRQWTMQIPRRCVYRATLARGSRAVAGKPEIRAFEARELVELN